GMLNSLPFSDILVGGICWRLYRFFRFALLFAVISSLTLAPERFFSFSLIFKIRHVMPSSVAGYRQNRSYSLMHLRLTLTGHRRLHLRFHAAAAGSWGGNHARS